MQPDPAIPMSVHLLTARVADLGAAFKHGSSDARSSRDQARPAPAHFAGTGTRRLTRLAAPVRGSSLRRALGNQGVPLSPAGGIALRANSCARSARTAVARPAIQRQNRRAKP